MKSALPKVLHRAGGSAADRSCGWRRRQLSEAGLDRWLLLVIRPNSCGRISRDGPTSELAIQEPQLGTGHALLQAEPFLKGKTGTVLPAVG